MFPLVAVQTFSPREVQARVRGGDSAEVIAAETGWPLDKVLRYAEPLLAERAFIAEQAQAVEVRRSGGGATLVEAARLATSSTGGSTSITWDAWRRDDGRWIVSASYRDGRSEHVALWTYDPAGRNLHPLDDQARTLMGARPLAVLGSDADIAEALDLVADIPVVREEGVEARPYLVAVPDAGDLDSGDPDSGDLDSGDLDSGTHIDVVAEDLFTPTEGSRSTERPARTTPARKQKGKRGRASVPSWDEILFGATKHDD